MTTDLMKEIIGRYPKNIKKSGETLQDPILSPYPFFCFLADNDPTTDEPTVYHGYDGLLLFWVNTTSHDLFVSTDNLDPTLGWSKIITSPIITSGATVDSVLETPL